MNCVVGWHAVSSAHRLSLVADGGVASNCVDGAQGVSAAHARLLELVGAAVWYSDLALHVLTALHRRSDVAVGAADSNWEPPPATTLSHAVSEAHCRSELAPAGTRSNSTPSLHTAREVHTRSLVAVGAVDSYCASLWHTVKAAHSRFDVEVGAAVWYCVAGKSHERTAVHWRSDDDEGGFDSY